MLLSHAEGDHLTVFEISSCDERFDASKLVVVGEHFRQGYGVITHVRYDEFEYYTEGRTRGQSFDVFLHT